VPPVRTTFDFAAVTVGDVDPNESSAV